MQAAADLPATARRTRAGLSAVMVAMTVVMVAMAVTSAGAVTVAPGLRDDYIPNPGIGFQAMHDLQAPALPETVAYRRPQYSWAEANPAQGVYDFSEIDADLAAAAALGKQFSFRLYTMRGEIFGGHQVPQWVLDEGATLVSGEPRYSDCIYQQRWSEFVEAMRARYDGDPDIAFIDISGYGNFNEWSWQDVQTEWDDDFANPTTLDGMARKRLADMFLGGAGTIDCRLPGGGTQSVSYDYPGFQGTQLVMPYAGIQQSTRYVAGRRADVGIRHDCLGSPAHTDGMLEKIGDVLAATWPAAPIGYELCGVEDLADALDVLEITHGSIVHENGGGNDVQGLMDTLQRAGYRFAFHEATWPQAAMPGSSIDVELHARNLGLAPAYAAMGQDFELRLYLLEAGGDVAHTWLLASDPNDWMPADPAGAIAPEQLVDETLALPGGLTQALYTLAVGILDLRRGVHITLANTGTDGEDRLVLGSLQLSDGEVCGDGLANAGVGEECDDGNTADGDCCSAACTLEVGACDDGDPCTTGDTCQAGVCSGGAPTVCNDGIDCTVDACQAGYGCTATPDDGACDDGLECSADVCQAGVGCTHAACDALCDDGDLCTSEVCNETTFECEYAATARSVCEAAGQAALQLADADGNEKLVWKWARGSIDAGMLGAPDTDADADWALCVYSGAELAMSANLPAGPGTCGVTSSCWKVRPGRLSYKRTDATPDGVASAKVSAGRPGKDKLQMKGRYSVLAVPDPELPSQMFALDAPVVVQTINAAGGCWGATFEAGDVSRNDPDSFKAKTQ